MLNICGLLNFFLKTSALFYIWGNHSYVHSGNRKIIDVRQIWTHSLLLWSCIMIVPVFRSLRVLMVYKINKFDFRWSWWKKQMKTKEKCKKLNLRKKKAKTGNQTLRSLLLLVANIVIKVTQLEELQLQIFFFLEL